ncbi:MAG: hypothetical protein ABFD69_07570 [Candidatus Sumerlaeia bacterium]
MFQYSAALQTTPEKALDRAGVIFAIAGFDVASAGRDELNLKGPGMWHSHQTLLRITTRGSINIGDGRLEFKAELGGLRGFRIAACVFWFIFLILTMTLVYSIDPDTRGDIILWIGMPIAALLNCLFSLGWIYKFGERAKERIRRALLASVAE